MAMTHLDTERRSVTRRLTSRYVLALVIVAVLTLLGQATVQVLLAQQTNDARLINTAAQQVTLSERIAKDALAIEGATDSDTVQAYAADLDGVVRQWSDAEFVLLNGVGGLGSPALNDQQVRQLFVEIAPDFGGMLDSTTAILVTVFSMPPIPLPGAKPLAPQISLNVQTVLVEEPGFVTVMKSIVAEYQHEAEGHVASLQIVEYALLGLVLVVLALLAFVVFRPVTRQIGEGVAELVRAQERERELAALKDQFIIDANHELRTPIMALYNNLEILQALGERGKPEQRKTILQRALTSGDAVLRLLTSVLDTSALEGRAPRLDLRPIELGPLVHGVLETFDPREVGEPGLFPGAYEARSVTIHIAPQLTVLADEGRLRQILINLLANALKYSDAGTPIAVSADLARPAGARRHAHDGQAGTPGQGELVQINVQDKGLGVPAGDIEKLFNRFVRLERDIAGPVRGTGVGLYMCRVLVEAMGGRIWVESSGIPLEGSTFSFTLPVPARAPVVLRPHSSTESAR
jgi:signal transduction histidine kinase